MELSNWLNDPFPYCKVLTEHYNVINCRSVNLLKDRYKQAKVRLYYCFNKPMFFYGSEKFIKTSVCKFGRKARFLWCPWKVLQVMNVKLYTNVKLAQTHATFFLYIHQIYLSKIASTYRRLLRKLNILKNHTEQKNLLVNISYCLLTSQYIEIGTYQSS
jgi:hypothetical protein